MTHYENKSMIFFETMYVLCKSIFLVMFVAIALNMFTIMILPIIVLLVSNFIENDYSYSKEILRGFTFTSLISLLLIGLSMNIIIFVYINIPLIYEGIIANIIRGLNIFAFIQCIWLVSYYPKFMFYNNISPLSAVKKSLIVSNLKIGISLMMVALSILLSMFIIVISGGYSFFLTAIIVFIYELMTSIVYKKIVGVKNE